ncbi:phage portal protein [Pseudooceanicola nanhaiensis]|uniref:phage portal protein n=1 Tax=Pseudooceanicola nanhaiensis TaxID=375761 RepID=UPI001CD64B0D|nr:phage portal protein [Pseudooceanicola nanhaiensis]MCA0919707.1 phage portal protein [Pseudooceanicola nanhaiensis]
MKLKHWIKSAFTRPVTLTDAESWRPSGQVADSGEIVSDSTVLGLSAVWACTNLLAGSIGSLPVMTYRTTEEGREPARDHALFRLLHDSPNYDQTALDFWEFVAASLELWGNAYAAVERESSGRLIALVPIRPDLVSVRRRESGTLEYRWTEDGQSHVRPDSGVLHIRGFGGNPLGGMSTLHFGRQAFGLARAIDRSAGTTFKNGMRPSGALTFKDWLSAEQREITKTVLVETFVGAQNTGRPLVLEGDTTWTPLTINPEDAQMLESRRFSVEEICRFFGVPPHMIGHTEKSTSWGTGLEQQTLAFQKFTLRRRLKRIEQAVNKQLLSAADRARGLYVEFNLEGLLRGDSASRSAFYQSGLSNGWLTINEVRARENLGPVEGGDVPRLQMQNVPITEAGQNMETGDGRD